MRRVKSLMAEELPKVKIKTIARISKLLPCINNGSDLGERDYEKCVF